MEQETKMKSRVANLKRHLLMAAELAERYPELMPLLERVEREYDVAFAHGATLARVRAKLEAADDN